MTANAANLVPVTEGQLAAARLRDHTKNHAFAGPPEDCFRCQRQQAVCRSKILFTTPWEGQGWADDLNLSRNHQPPVVTVYRCVWGVSVHWHLKTAKRVDDFKRVERQRRKLLRRNASDANNAPQTAVGPPSTE